MSKYQIQSDTLFEDFETLGDWTISSGSADVDTNIYKTGSKSLKLTSASGTNCIATKTINSDLSSAGRISIWMYVESLAEISSFQIILSSTTDFTKFFSYSFSSYLHEGWNKIIIGRDMWTNTGADSWSNTMVRLRVRVNANASSVAVLRFDSMYINGYNRPKCVVTFDDGWDSGYTYGFQYMKNFNFKGTTYIIPSLVDTAGYCTSEQIQEMYDYGWDVSTHDSGNWADDYSDADTLTEQINSIKSFIKLKGWSRNKSEFHAAYPQGGYDSVVIQAMTDTNMLTGRTIIDRTQAHELDEEYYITRQAIYNTTTLANAKISIDRAISSGGVIILNFHKIEPVTADASTEVLQADFEDLMDYLYQKSNSIDVITLTEWYIGLNNPRKIITI